MEHAAVLVRRFEVRNTNLVRIKDQWTPNSPNLNSWLYTMAGGYMYVVSYHKRHSKPNTIVELQGNAVDDLGQPA